MELTTQCPECGTQFEASLEQLQLRKGYIRCISCAHIFDGFDAVVPTTGRQSAHSVGTPSSPAIPMQAELRQTQQPVHTMGARRTGDESIARVPSTPHVLPGIPGLRVGRPGHSVATASVSSDRSRPADEPQALDRLAEPVFLFSGVDRAERSQDGSVTEPLVSDSGSAVESASVPVYLEPRDPDAPQIPGFLGGRQEETPSALTAWVLRLLVLLALLAAAAQLVYIYRVQIATQLPFLRPPLEQACQALGCTVHYPRLIDQIAIVDSSLKKVAESAPGVDHDMVLHVLLRNHYDKPQQWPNLSLDLNDFSGATVARLHLDPASYLTEHDLQYPFPARTEIQITLPLSVSDRQVNGYQLGKYFP